MSTRQKAVLTIESILAMFSGALALLTVFWRDWIEAITGWDPDHHNGSLEVVIVIGLVFVTVLVGTSIKLTSNHFRRLNCAH